MTAPATATKAMQITISVTIVHSNDQGQPARRTLPAKIDGFCDGHRSIWPIATLAATTATPKLISRIVLMYHSQSLMGGLASSAPMTVAPALAHAAAISRCQRRRTKIAA
jgi:hypothetical protein